MDTSNKKSYRPAQNNPSQNHNALVFSKVGTRASKEHRVGRPVFFNGPQQKDFTENIEFLLLGWPTVGVGGGVDNVKTKAKAKTAENLKGPQSWHQRMLA